MTYTSNRHGQNQLLHICVNSREVNSSDLTSEYPIEIWTRDFWCNSNRDIRAKPYCSNVYGPNHTNSGEVYISGHLTTRATLIIFHHDFSGVGCSAWTV